MSQETPTTSNDLSKTYEPQNVESRWFDIWEKSGYMKPADSGKPFTIVIPPPNVTGSLHMGHALNSTLQDIIIRYKKMKGSATLWIPGTDHGGIATQNVVERLLKKENTNRHEMGREKFLEKMWNWRNEAGDQILFQLRRLGASLDYSRLRFTMDEVCSKAVRKAFVELYQRQLLYRGKRLVNWCPRCHTALADIEVDHKDVSGHLWHIKYPLVDRRKKNRTQAKSKNALTAIYDQGYVVVATTRPETLLGDTGVAVNPKDKRYKSLIGATIKLPLTNREIPLVADSAVDSQFGSGAVKVTPSHDQTDFEIAERANLPHITVIGFDGKMTADAGEAYKGLDRFEARKKVVADLEQLGAIEKIEDYKVAVSVCYRCDNIIEPLESEQWFLKMAHMAKAAREANKKGKVKILPKSWESPYQLWLRNIRDWCVSRQIWWGHRIPVWYCIKTENGKKIKTDCPPIVQMEDPTHCSSCQSKNIEQDPDVLDTWFSSALWPISVFHWPDESEDLKRFFPTAVLVTGHEILYLWVARMIMFSLEFQKKIPFSTVLIHGIVRDKQGRKMSKSIGNVIDPLDLIKEFGADAVRMSLAQMAAPGRDMHLSRDNFIGNRNFSNKIWNATRFSLMHLKGENRTPTLAPEKVQKFSLPDKWILHRLATVIDETTKAMEVYDIDAAARGLYDFFWGDLCDWYLEMVKPRLLSGDDQGAELINQEGENAKVVLATVLEASLRMLHPFMPFITEELWQRIPKSAENKAVHVMDSIWPSSEGQKDENAEKEMTLLMEIITKIRTIRSEMGIPPSQRVDLYIQTSNENFENLIKNQEKIITSLNSRVGKITMGSDVKRPDKAASAVVPGANLYVPLEGLIDFNKEKARLEKERNAVKQDSDRMSKKLANTDFLSHAPEEEIEKAKARLVLAKERLTRLEDNISALS